MVDVALQGVWVLYSFNKDEDDGSPPLLAFQRHVVNAIFLKYLKEPNWHTRYKLNTGVFRTPSNI